ncbi:thiol-disulfide oxidoreductase DCC family protein [Spirosoma koreense]
MKKLIIYDGSCPMCRLYTKGIVATDKSGSLMRMSNDQIKQEAILNRLDRQRARHEIPLVDLDGGETLYGVDTWAYALGQPNPSIQKLLSIHWFRALLQKLYAFISYNRRIIITSPPGRWQLLDLQPAFNPGQRLAFIGIVFSLVAALFLSGRVSVWPPAAFALVISQLTLTGIYLFVLQPGEGFEKILDYAGHLGMSLLVGSSVMALSSLLGWTTLGLMGYALMIGQHFIRTYRLGLNPWLSVCFTVLALLLLR